MPVDCEAQTVNNVWGNYGCLWCQSYEVHTYDVGITWKWEWVAGP